MTINDFPPTSKSRKWLIVNYESTCAAWPQLLFSKKAECIKLLLTMALMQLLFQQLKLEIYDVVDEVILYLVQSFAVWYNTVCYNRVFATVMQRGVSMLFYGLYLIQQDLEVIRGKENIELTPNAVEFKRLVEEANKLKPVSINKLDCVLFNFILILLLVLQFEETISEQLTLPQQTESLASKLGHVTIVCKGKTDIISDGHKGKIVILMCSSNAFCNFTQFWSAVPKDPVYGQGDILSGSMGKKE